MKQCPQCRFTFNELESHPIPGQTDEIMQELIEQQKTSDLCLDCLLEKKLIELGAVVLGRRI